MAMLEIENLDVHYGGIHALKGVSFSVEEGQIVTLIGANGAGKTTTLRAISGMLKIAEGTVQFDGDDITGVAPHHLVSRGLSHVPEGRGIFANLTVSENLDLGGYRRARARRAENRERVYSIFPRLAERQSQSAGTLSGGEQQMLAIGRGLMAEPRLLILDEPSLGLSPKLVEELFNLVKTINAQGIALLLVEQNVMQSLEVASRAYVLDNGAIVLQGNAGQVRDDPNLKRAYLGM